MHRLFVAIRPPRAIRERLIGLMGGVSGARWLSDDQIHLTLRFIGEVDRHLASDVHAALGSIHHPAFEIALDGMHVFDRRGEPVTLWVGATPQESLRALHKKVDQACLLAGIAPDRRTFLPHITIARLGRGSGPITSALEIWGGVTSDRFTVGDFCLYESDLTPDGPIYTLVERYSLD